MLNRADFKTGFEKMVMTPSILPRSATLIKYEFLLRCMLKEETQGKTTVADAVNLCDEFIATDPNDAFFQYARSWLTPDRVEAKKYLLNAYKLAQPQDRVATLAAYDLAHVCLSQEDFIAAQSWHARAVIGVSNKAAEEFLGDIGRSNFGKFSHLPLTENFVKTHAYSGVFSEDERFIQKQTLSMCEFFLVALCKSNPHVLLRYNESAWFRNFAKPSTKDLLVRVYNDVTNKSVCQEVRNQHAIMSRMIDVLFRGNGFIFIEFVAFCQRSNIITDAVFHDLMAGMLFHILQREWFTAAGKELYGNKIRIELFLFYLRTGNFITAQEIFTLIDCKHFKVSHFKDLPNQIRECWFYQIFARLVSARKADEATSFFTSMQDVRLYDATVLDYFYLCDEEAKKPALFALRRDKLQAVVAEAAKGAVYHPMFIELTKIEVDISNSIVTEIRFLFFEILETYINYIEDRERNKGRAASLFGHGEKPRQNLLTVARNLQNSAVLRTDFVVKLLIDSSAFHNLAANIEQFIDQCESKIAGNNTTKMISKMRELYKRLSEKISIMTQDDVENLKMLQNSMASILLQQQTQTTLASHLGQEAQYYMIPIGAELPPGSEVVAVTVQENLPPVVPPPTYDEAMAGRRSNSHPQYATPTLFSPAVPLQPIPLPFGIFEDPHARHNEGRPGYP